jgi:hypothetical protein
VVEVSNGTTVLGSWDRITGGYVSLAKNLGANYFEVPLSIWNKMTPVEKWTANVKYLDEAIARGDKFVLSNSAFKAKEGTFFYKELEYLKSKGYMPSENGMSLIKSTK